VQDRGIEIAFSRERTAQAEPNPKTGEKGDWRRQSPFFASLAIRRPPQRGGRHAALLMRSPCGLDLASPPGI
jgi:hypothetical protein